MPDLEVAVRALSACACILLGPDVQCDEPAEVEFVIGCVHEHLAIEELCARHAGLARDGKLVCTECAPLGVREIAHVLSENGRRALR